MRKKRNYDERFIAFVNKLSSKAFDDRSDQEITKRLYELMCFWINRLKKLESINKVICSELNEAEMSLENEIEEVSPSFYLEYKKSNEGYLNDFLQMSYVQLYHKYESFNRVLNDLIESDVNSKEVYKVLKLGLGVKLKKGQLYPKDNQQKVLDKMRHISNCIKHYDGNVKEYKSAKVKDNLDYIFSDPYNGKILLNENMYAYDLDFVTSFIGYHCLQILLAIISIEDKLGMDQFKNIINELGKLIKHAYKEI